MRWVWLLSATALEVYADFLLKKWSLGAGAKYAVWGFLIYGIGGIGWGYLLKHESLQRAIVLFTVVNILAVVAVGHYFFGERLGVKEQIGVALAFAAVAFMEWS